MNTNHTAIMNIQRRQLVVEIGNGLLLLYS